MILRKLNAKLGEKLTILSNAKGRFDSTAKKNKVDLFLKVNGRTKEETEKRRRKLEVRRSGELL